MALKSRHNHFDVSASALKYFCLFRRLGAVFFLLRKPPHFLFTASLNSLIPAAGQEFASNHRVALRSDEWCMQFALICLQPRNRDCRSMTRLKLSEEVERVSEVDWIHRRCVDWHWLLRSQQLPTSAKKPNLDHSIDLQFQPSFRIQVEMSLMQPLSRWRGFYRPDPWMPPRGPNRLPLKTTLPWPTPNVEELITRRNFVLSDRYVDRGKWNFLKVDRFYPQKENLVVRNVLSHGPR